MVKYFSDFRLTSFKSQFRVRVIFSCRFHVIKTLQVASVTPLANVTVGMAKYYIFETNELKYIQHCSKVPLTHGITDGIAILILMYDESQPLLTHAPLRITCQQGHAVSTLH